MTYDLHVHTKASDGIFTPSQIVNWGGELGLTGLAITDHDTVDGIAEAIKAGETNNVQVIPGIEISCECISDQGNPCEVHILGFFIDYKDQEFLDKLNFLQNKRRHRAVQILDILDANNISLDRGFLEEYQENGSVGRGIIARQMVQQGYIKDVATAFEKWLGIGCIAYVSRVKITPVEAIQLIKSVGGASVIAHPGLAGVNQMISHLVQAGLAGIEANHPMHSQEQIAYYRRLAKELSLVETGGSDCHDSNLGKFTTSISQFEALQSRK